MTRYRNFMLYAGIAVNAGIALDVLTNLHLLGWFLIICGAAEAYVTLIALRLHQRELRRQEIDRNRVGGW